MKLGLKKKIQKLITVCFTNEELRISCAYIFSFFMLLPTRSIFFFFYLQCGCVSILRLLLFFGFSFPRRFFRRETTVLITKITQRIACHYVMALRLIRVLPIYVIICTPNQNNNTQQPHYYHARILKI